ncbi:Proteasome subunit beta type-1 [Nowakowskiella sp. JEL0407]|nr:Proteasome subunit beta type-1 [Nowakowskiella sp. JEL0407]
MKPGEVDLGTTIMAVQFKDGVIVGADSRTTTGSYIANRVTDKLTPVHDRIFCCRSGSAADTQAIADIVHYYLQMFTVEQGKPPQVHTAASLFQELVYSNKDKLSAGIIVAGIDKVDGPSVWSIPLGGSLHKQPFAIGGSGSTYIYGYCDAAFKDGMSKEEAIAFTKNGGLRYLLHKRRFLRFYLCAAVSLAMSRDGSSGGVIRLAVITNDGVERIFVPGDQLPEFWQG